MDRRTAVESAACKIHTFDWLNNPTSLCSSLAPPTTIPGPANLGEYHEPKIRDRGCTACNRFVPTDQFSRNRPMTSAIAAGLAAHHRRALSVVSGYVCLDAPQAPAQPFCKLVPCAPQTRLQRVLGYSELLRSFAGRVALHLAQHKRG